MLKTVRICCAFISIISLSLLLVSCGDDGDTYITGEGESTLVATAASSTEINLTWPDLAADEPVAYFDIYMDGAFLNYTLAAAPTEYTVSGLIPGTQYCFMVVGLDSSLTTVVQSQQVCTAAGGDSLWLATNTNGAPSARIDNTAVWSGSKMLVWGGYDGGDVINTGGIYDPGTDSWALITTSGAPSARTQHTAVWTGSKMLVWGGYDSGFFNTGGIYDPDTDSWAPTSTSGAPAGRTGNTMVWSGSRMLVWGGYDGGYLNTGGILRIP